MSEEREGAENRPKPKARENLIPELLERNHFLPVAKAISAFATAYLDLKHQVTACQFNQDRFDASKMSVSVQVNVKLPQEKKMDYITMNIPVVIPLPPGSLFEKTKGDAGEFDG